MNLNEYNLMLDEYFESGEKNNYDFESFEPRQILKFKTSKKLDFWINYCSEVDNGNKNLYLAEKPNEILPVIVDFLFEFDYEKEDQSEEPFEDDLIYDIVYCYQQTLLEYFNVINENDPDDYTLISCHVFESKRYKIDDKIDCLKLRIQFPYCLIDIKEQLEVLKPNVIKRFRSEKTSSRFQIEPIKKWDETILNNLKYSISLYGSSYKESEPSLEYKFTLGYIDKEIENGEKKEEANHNARSLPLDENFPVSNHQMYNLKLITEDIINEYEYDFWYPLIFSINYWSEQSITLKNKEEKDNNESSVKDSLISDKLINNPSDKELAIFFLNLLNISRFIGDEITWLTVGKAIYQIYDGEEDGLKLFILKTEEATKKINNIKEFLIYRKTIKNTCEFHYNSFNNVHNTIKTLAWFAREDSPKIFKTWQTKWINSSIMNSLSNLGSDIAKCIYRNCWLKHVYSPTTKRWFYFHKHNWREDPNALKIRKMIVEDFVNLFERYRAKLSQEISENDNKQVKEQGEINIKNVNKLIAKLKDRPQQFISHLEVEFEYQKFESVLDDNLNLLGVNNGVLEISGGEIFFRPGRPEDYIHKHMYINYNKDLSYNDPSVKTLLDWFNKAFCDEDEEVQKEVVNHFLKFCASTLKGGNTDKLFVLFSGAKGDNTKSGMIKLFEETLGPYCFKFKAETFASKKFINASGATPELFQATKTRVGFIDEFEGQGKISKRMIKVITGSDTFFVRGNYQDGEKIKPSFKIIGVCNDPPEFEDFDQAMINRFRIFPFNSRFLVENVPETEREQKKKKIFKADKNFNEKIKYLSVAFLWLMTENYSRYVTEGLVDPLKIKKATEQYWKDNDFYKQFIDDNYSKSKNEEDIIFLKDIYNNFRLWYSENNPDTKIPNAKDFKKEMITRLGDLTKNKYWTGYTEKDEDEDNENNKKKKGKKNYGNLVN